MKHGVQSTTTDDGPWSVSQLVEKAQSGPVGNLGNLKGKELEVAVAAASAAHVAI
jgi:hypothetical protein